MFRQDFDADFDPAVAGLLPGYSGKPYAFTRWADGEAAILFGWSHRAKSDGWEWPAGKKSLLTEALWGGLVCSLPGWHVGITAESHHRRQHRELLRRVQVPMSRVTFAELFIFGNQLRFGRLNLAGCHFVGPHESCDFPIPRDAMATDWLWQEFTRNLIDKATRPIVVAAGPLANAIIFDYWRWTECQPEKRQTIVDVGSAIANRLHTRRIRAWQRPGDPLADWRPEWKIAAEITE